MYVKSLKELAIFAFAFNYDKLYTITDFDELSLQTREQIVQWLLDHDTGLLDKSLLQDRYEKRTWVDCSPIVPNSSADDAANRYRTRQQSSWRNVFHLSFRSRQKMVAAATPAGNQLRESGPESQQAVLSGSFDELESMDEMEYTIFRLFGETKLFSNITRLTVTKSLMLCDELLMCFSQQCGHLRSVKLSHCLYITDEGFSHLVSNGRLSQLETLKIESCNNFCGSSLAQLDTNGNLVSICLKFLRLNWKGNTTFT
ncbi:uncharacterized protein LOC142357388 [Convolutriloba macropyga]|uniref:uncharacterized protein LOC142357388 n=1 Tax=Convolutriloba macropyga TaxID=536237 RepID=UPI003F5267BC